MCIFAASQRQAFRSTSQNKNRHHSRDDLNVESPDGQPAHSSRDHLWSSNRHIGYSDRTILLKGGHVMPDRAYLVKFKPPALGAVQTVVASTVEIHDEHLIFCNANGDLAA